MSKITEFEHLTDKFRKLSTSKAPESNMNTNMPSCIYISFRTVSSAAYEILIARITKAYRI